MKLQQGDYCKSVDSYFIVLEDLVKCSDGYLRHVSKVERITRDPNKFLRWIKSLGVWSPGLEELHNSGLYNAPETRPSLWIALSLSLNSVKDIPEDLKSRIRDVLLDKEVIPDGIQVS